MSLPSCSWACRSLPLQLRHRRSPAVLAAGPCRGPRLRARGDHLRQMFAPATMLFLGHFGGSLGGLCSGRSLAACHFLLHPTVLAALLELVLSNPAVSVRIDHLEVHDKRGSLALRQNFTPSFGLVPNAVALSFIYVAATPDSPQEVGFWG